MLKHSSFICRKKDHEKSKLELSCRLDLINFIIYLLNLSQAQTVNSSEEIKTDESAGTFGFSLLR